MSIFKNIRHLSSPVPALVCAVLIFALLSSRSHAQQKGGQPVQSATGPSQPEVDETYAVVVGISDYQDPGIPDLKYAHRDAMAFANFLRSPAGGSLDGDHLKVLLDSDATAGQVASALYWLIDVSEAGDRAIIYFSGHGDVETRFRKQPGFLLCWDAPASIYMAGGVVDLRMLQDVISALSENSQSKVLVIADACRSGKLSGSSIGGAQATTASLMQQYASEVKILSCQPDEYSLEGEQWGNGRGAFSYHLINGLYGLADEDSNGMVDLMEIQRYLQENVRKEVAPLRQIPVALGNFNRQLFSVDREMLDLIEDEQSHQILVFTPTADRGIEDRILSKADSSVRNLYFAFYKSLEDKRFLSPDQHSADFYYTRLIEEPALSPLYSAMRRNFAAVLQDDAQQVMNNILMTDPEELELSRISKSRKYADYPAYLHKAAELLGEGHYMYPALMARMKFFEGFLLELKHYYPDEDIGRRIIGHYHQALNYQANLPHVYLNMASVFGRNLLHPDSMEYYTVKASEALPEWVLPYTNIVDLLLRKFRDHEKAKYYLDKAIELDANNAYTLIASCIYFNSSTQDLDSAYAIAKKAVQLYPDNTTTLMNLGFVCARLGQYDEAKKHLKKAIEINPTSQGPYIDFAAACFYDNDMELGEKYLKKAYQLDTLSPYLLNSLGGMYILQGKYKEAEEILYRVIEIDSTTSHVIHFNLACLYSVQNKVEKGFEHLETSLIKGFLYTDLLKNDPYLDPLRQEEERWNSLIEEYFPEGEHKD